jgi:hypothetical protein
MKSFILRENIKRLSAALGGRLTDSERRHLGRELVAMKRELVRLDAERIGAQSYPAELGPPPPHDGSAGMVVTARRTPALLLDPRPGLSIVAENGAHAREVRADNRDAVGRGLFDVLADNPDLNETAGLIPLFDALRRACGGRAAVTVPHQRLDVLDRARGFLPRFWHQSIAPLFDGDGRLTFLLIEMQDVTATVGTVDGGAIAVPNRHGPGPTPAPH